MLAAFMLGCNNLLILLVCSCNFQAMDAEKEDNNGKVQATPPLVTGKGVCRKIDCREFSSNYND